jgi:hypothetical protein
MRDPSKPAVPRIAKLRIAQRSGPRVRSRSNTRPARRGSCRTGQAAARGSPCARPNPTCRAPRHCPLRSTRARVAVITRTKNRPVLLRRAADSVGEPEPGDFTWTVVNDGGDAEEVAAIMRAAPIDPRRMRLVSHDESQGMEAASNAGIAACDSDYIVIHDDDDSWLPDFLERTVAFLDSPEGARYGGVATHSLYISEEIRGDTVVEHDSRPYNDWVRNVHLSEMACGNFFPPIAFVFRRRCLSGSAASTKRCRCSATGSSTSNFCWRTTSPSCPNRWRAITTATAATRTGGLCQFGHRRRLETRGIRRRRPQRLPAPPWRQGGCRSLFRDGIRRQRPQGAHRATVTPKASPPRGPRRAAMTALVRGRA